MRRKNELGRVLETIRDFEQAGVSRRLFARRRGLHPSALSRILRVAALPSPLLEELGRLPRLSRTHLEVLASAPLERREEVLAAIRDGRSTYRLRERVERSGKSALAPPAPSPALLSPPVAPAVEREKLEAMTRALDASSDETLAFAVELLSVLWTSGRGRLLASFESFRASRAPKALAG